MLDLPSDSLISAWRESVRGHHDERVKTIHDRLSDREKALVREAAVMGFVQGRMDAGMFDGPMPKDSEIVYRTLDGIGGFPDIYPVLAAYTPEAA